MRPHSPISSAALRGSCNGSPSMRAQIRDDTAHIPRKHLIIPGAYVLIFASLRPPLAPLIMSELFGSLAYQPTSVAGDVL
jgi:hypothetical protein